LPARPAATRTTNKRRLQRCLVLLLIKELFTFGFVVKTKLHLNQDQDHHFWPAKKLPDPIQPLGQL